MFNGLTFRALVAASFTTALATTAAASPQAALPASPSGGYARVHHVVSTQSAAAQAYFDRGLTLLYAFNRRAARESFLWAAAADPHLAMAYWGVAMSYGGNINVPQDAAGEREAANAASKARGLESHASPPERAYIATLAHRFTAAPKPNFDALARSYAAAMAALAAEYPGDPDAATLYAESEMDLRPWDLYAVDGTPRPGTQNICATLESVLRRFPTHIGANHLYIHATEGGLHPELALQAAGRIASRHFEPAASHLTHMPAHTLARTGYYGAAGGSNVLATAYDRSYLGSEGRDDKEQPGYYIHDLTFLAFTDAMDGNFERERSTMARLQKMGQIVPITFVLLRYGRWHDILALKTPKPDQYDPLRFVYWRFARAMAFAARTNLTMAIAERNAMHRAAAASPLPPINGFTNGSVAIAHLADLTIDAEIGRATNEEAREIAALRAAAAAQDRFIYIEPPDWYGSAREALGGALLRAGRDAGAAIAFRTDLTRNPGNPRSLYGLSRALTAEGKSADATRVRAQYVNAWKNATVALTEASL